jgi:hypothetical protein
MIMSTLEVDSNYIIPTLYYNIEMVPQKSALPAVRESPVHSGNGRLSGRSVEEWVRKDVSIWMVTWIQKTTDLHGATIWIICTHYDILKCNHLHKIIIII